jgi:hypothetical protein
MCILHHAQGDEERMFLCLTSKPRSAGFLVWLQNQGQRVFQFGPQNR